MCGIIAYIGQREANPLLISGLEKLEYRGYDSAGIATISENQIHLHKMKGRVHHLKDKTLPGKIGIAHTRWSTHGCPSDQNAHPFLDLKNSLAVVHNGIIENYLELKDELRTEGIYFSSDTDSEVIVHLLSKYYCHDLKETVIRVLKKIIGSYAFCVIQKDSQDIIAAKNGSPLLIGLGRDENFLASDASALIEHTKKVIYLQDYQVARITPNTVQVYNFNGEEQKSEIKTIDWNLEQAQKEGYKHFMLKEIFEQPKVIEKTLKVTIDFKKEFKKDFNRIIIIACGTASYAGHIGKYLLEKLARIPVEVEIASEFRYKNPLLAETDLVLAISQSGETADTLAAVRLAKESGAKTLGIINVVDSSIAREVDSVIYTRAGPEIGVASTKAFMAQMIILYKLAFHLAEKESKADIKKLEDYLEKEIIPKIQQTLVLNKSIFQLVKKYALFQHFIYIGRNINYPLALEGALKLKEISYIHAEAYPAGELKHGPIALISEQMPTLAICLQDQVYHKTFSNIEEIKARNGKIVLLATEGDEKVKTLCEDIIYIPKVEEIFYPLIAIIPLQLFAYHLADIKECDIDKPRNLAKSVTVE